MNLDIESLRTLLAVLDHGGMTSAARHLGVSQSAVSWKIKRLEERVGRPLLIREGRSLRPSSDGRRLLDDARAMVEIHDRAVARLRSSELTGTVRLGSNIEADPARLSAALGRFKRSHPAATIEFVMSDSAELKVALAAGDVDVALMQVEEADLRPDDHRLWSDQLVWVTCCETPYDEGEVPLITFGDTCIYRALTEPILVEQGIDYAITFSGRPSYLGVLSAVRAGLGVAVLSSRFLGGDLVEWERGRSLGPLPQVHQVARVTAGLDSEIGEALVDALVAELGDEPALEAVAG